MIVGGVGVDGDVMNRAIDGTPDLMSGRRASLRPTIFSSGHHHIPACRAQTRRTSIICFPVGQKKTFCLQNIKEQRADEGGAKEVRMMIMGPDPAQDNLTVHKLLSDTEAPVTQLAEESLGSSLSKRLGLVCGSYG